MKREATHQFQVRIPLTTLKKLDKFAEKKSAETGMLFTRTDAVRVLLTKALRSEEKS